MNFPPSRQHGATLMIALIMLAVILLLGIASASLLMLDERAARNHRAHEQARIAAQAALDDACEEIRRGIRIDAAHAFPAEHGCHTDRERLGLCLGSAHVAGWQSAQLTGAAAGSASYGQFTGNLPPNLGDGLPAPRYLIELVAGADDTIAPSPSPLTYRLSAIGFGRDGAQALLQGVVQRRTDAAGKAQCMPLGWRALPPA
ncbi:MULTISPECIES: PilX N-terminal domain-containing pilus assembly protein [unclassified Herbaspirillum]|uniref:pilus assembly PilX family protein n=1 Tax=unclassified Herbaspirillum TaxID=2624150 RepID=UPI00115224B5|nr:MULTISPECIES: PilX N-terminal domain-containing pilus assembly protein [unclassified Herbaspirillum]MBB5391484.1 type IV pilus assembly protein PilX [Herbaspirillum sp. SJZ102]TQK12832.1 type IV pilus assembly protein PilX [Herbaspirillum sp. SJZ130]TQK14836.1 type IV pilus assembly protein PilX [Herbaspirillum sp. SJZ106]